MPSHEYACQSRAALIAAHKRKEPIMETTSDPYALTAETFLKLPDGAKVWRGGLMLTVISFNGGRYYVDKDGMPHNVEDPAQWRIVPLGNQVNVRSVIRTRYHGPGYKLGSRYSANAGLKRRVVIPAPHHLSVGEAKHKAAAEALCKKFGWTGQLIGGELPNGDYCWLFID